MPTLTAAYLGATQVSRAYIGATLVLDIGGAPAAPVLSALVIDDPTDTITITADVASEVYYRVNTLGLDPDAATIIAGGGDAAGSFPAASGDNTEALNFPSGLDDTYQISFAARVEPNGDPSNVLRGTIEIVTIMKPVGAESASEVGLLPGASGDPWAFTGSVVDNIPADEGWSFTGSVVTTIPAA